MTRLKIGRSQYRLIFRKTLPNDDLGQCDFEKRLITVKRGQKNEANTVLHEILHAICDEQKINLEYEQEERVVNRITNGLQEFLIKNQAFGEQLLRELMK
jgi:hypothetical protein